MRRFASLVLAVMVAVLLAACNLTAQPEQDLTPQHAEGGLAMGPTVDDGHDDHVHRADGVRDPSAELEARDEVAAALEAAGVISDGPSARVTKNLAVVGSGEREVAGATTDVWAHGRYAYTGTFNEPCGGDPDAGIWVWDVRNANRPDRVTVVESPEGSRSNDVRVGAMNSGDIMVHSNEACATGGPGGFEVYDVDDPTDPVHLASVRIDELNPISDALFGGLSDVGVHNLFLFTQGDEDYVAVTSEGGFDNFRIYDITDPTAPSLTSAWGAEELFDPGVGDETTDVDRVLEAAIWLSGDGFGASQHRFLHDVTVTADGTHAYLANWDAGLVLLDISDPSDPQVVSVAIDPENGSLDGEVNSHSAWPSEDGSIVVEGEEDFSAWEALSPPSNLTFGEGEGDPIPGTALSTQAGNDFENDPTGSTGTVESSLVTVTDGPLSGNQYAAVELAGDQPPIPAEGITGAFVWIGRACDGDGILNADEISEGDIAVARRGACTFREKNLNAGDAGAAAILIANNVQTSTPWSGLRIWDYSDPEDPVLASTFDTECSASTEPGGPCDPTGTYSSHNVIVETLGTQVLAYVSWYSDGMLVLDVTDPYDPVEIARYDNDPDDTDYWGVYKIPNEPWIYGSDRNGGLDLFKTLGSGSQGKR